MHEKISLEGYKRAILNNQTSYKFALGLALAEIINNESIVNYQEISRKVAEYYFKHHFIYKINQSNNPSQIPIVITILQEYIKNTYGTVESIKKLSKGDLDNLSRYIINPKKMCKQFNRYELALNLNTNKGFFCYTLPCWQNAKKVNCKDYYNYISYGENEFFTYNSKSETIKIKENFFELITTRRELVADITVSEWVKFVEKFNILPRLYQKISPVKPNRTTSKFGVLFEYIDILEGHKCFLCNKPITHRDITDRNQTLDHVIPFSYIFSCELWNLVRAHRSCNSSKSDKIGSPEMIKKLIQRNVELWYKEDDILQQFKASYYNGFKNQFISVEDMIKKIYKIVIDCKVAGFEQLQYDKDSERNIHGEEDLYKVLYSLDTQHKGLNFF